MKKVSLREARELAAECHVPSDFPTKAESKRAWERGYVLSALRAAGGLVTGAATASGLDLGSFYAMSKRAGFSTIDEARGLALAEVPERGRPELVAVAVVRVGDRLLCAQRRDCGLWELPGGRVEAGENVGAAAAREVEEELEVQVKPTSLVDFFVRDDVGIAARSAALAFVACTAPGPRAPLKVGPSHLAAEWLRVPELMGRVVMPSLAEFARRGGLAATSKGIPL